MIKTIIFDNGGVLVEDFWPKFEENLKDKYQQVPGNNLAKIFEYSRQTTTGQRSFETLIEEIRKLTKDDEDFYDLYHPKAVRPEVIAYAKEVGQDFELALLTNELSNFDRDNKLWQLERSFGQNIFQSSKIGLSKPDPKIYQYVLEKLQRKPKEVIFIDDKERNLEGARKVGLNTLQFMSLDQLKKDLPKLVKEVNDRK